MALPGEEGVGSTMVAVAAGWGIDVDGTELLATLLARNQTDVRRIHPNTRAAIIFFMEALVFVLILPLVLLITIPFTWICLLKIRFKVRKIMRHSIIRIHDIVVSSVLVLCFWKEPV